jgi:hypothetical protein
MIIDTQREGGEIIFFCLMLFCSPKKKKKDKEKKNKQDKKIDFCVSWYFVGVVEMVNER